MTERSLVRRAIVLVLLAEFVCALAFSLTALWHERRSRLRAFDVMLQGRADSLLGAIQDAEDPEDNVIIDPTELKLPADDVYAVYNRGGRLLGSSPDAPAALASRQADGLRDVMVNGERYRVLQTEGLRIIDREETGGAGLRRPVTIVYASRTSRIWSQIAEAARFYSIVSVVFLCATALILVVLLRRLLHPLDEIASAAADVRANSLHFEAPSSALQTRELRPLAEALNATLSRLREAFEMEHRFVSDAAHELKTAVAVVRSTVQLLLLRQRTPEEYVAGLREVLEDNERVEQLVARMLTLARFEEAAERHAGPVDLAAIARATVAKLRRWSEAHAVSVVLGGDEAVQAPMTAEAAETLISNLVMNAVQHSSRGSEVRLSVATQPGGQVLLQVIDSGAGIAPESLPHIFDRFFREDRSRSRETGGAGLGLAICKSIVEGCGGAITVESALGKGTTVTAAFSYA